MFIAAVNFCLGAQFLYMKYTASFYAPINVLPEQGEREIGGAFDLWTLSKGGDVLNKN